MGRFQELFEKTASRPDGIRHDVQARSGRNVRARTSLGGERDEFPVCRGREEELELEQAQRARIRRNLSDDVKVYTRVCQR